MERQPILVLEDNLEILSQIKEALGDQFDLVAASTLDQAKELLEKMVPTLLIIDQDLREMNGIECFRQLRRSHRRVRAVMMSEAGNIRAAVLATKMGVLEFFRKPLDPAHFRAAIDRLLAVALEAGPDFSEQKFPSWLGGVSHAIEHFVEDVGEAVGSDKDIFLLGEPGTDSPSIVSFMHEAGRERKRRLIRMDVSAFQKEPLEAHFWGALRELLQEPELVSEVEEELCGTLYLSGVEEVPAHFQESLFQFLRERAHSRGAWRVNPNVRVVVECGAEAVAAMWEKNGWLVNFYRLNIPPMSSRREDLPWLIAVLIKEIAERRGREKPTVSPEVLQYVSLKPQEGDVQELENMLERATLWAEKALELSDLPIVLSDWIHAELEPLFLRHTWRLAPALENFERRFLQLIIQKAGGDIEKVSLFLDMPKSQLMERLERLGINREPVPAA